MTNKLEKQFFDAFEIEPKLDCKRCNAMAFAPGQCAEVNCEKKYPQITDRILIELIFLQPLSIEFKYPRNIKKLKDTLFGYYIEELSLFTEPSEAEIFKQQVQALFKEHTNDR